MSEQGSGGNVVAALCSFFIPGLGQLLQGRVGRAFLQFFLAIALWFILLGWLVHLWSVIDAARFSPGPQLADSDALQGQHQINKESSKRSTPPHVIFTDDVLVIPQFPGFLNRPLWCVDQHAYGPIREGDWVKEGDVITSFVVKHPSTLSMIMGNDSPILAEVHSPISGRLLLRRYWPFGDHGDAPEPIQCLCAIEIPKGQRIPETLTNAFSHFCDTLWRYREAVFQKPLDGSFPMYSDEYINLALKDIRSLTPKVRSKNEELYRYQIEKFNLERPDTIGSPKNLDHG